MTVDLATVTQSPTGAAAARVRPGARQELRLALAMRGGSSLAVWIGGAVAEIERLRRSGVTTPPAVEGPPPEDIHPVYRALLDLAGYGTVLVDVLAGASAGGLNATVYAAAQCHGFDLGQMRDIWLLMGDIETASRATTSAGRAAEGDPRRERAAAARDAVRPPSLLDGDGYFYKELADKLEEFINQKYDAGARHLRPVEQMDLLLSATLFAPRDVQQLLNRFNRVRETGSEALFRFRRAPGRDDLADLPSARPLAEALAMAARSTSSFPFAFEPARISVGTGRCDGVPDFGDTFELPGGRPVGDVRVIDGGTLDNIPVTAAIRAIVDSPAKGLTDRWLFYLHPSPPDPSEQADDDNPDLNSPGAVATLIRTAMARFGVESLLDDVRELEAVNEASRRRRLTMAAAFGGFTLEGDDVISQLTDACEDRARELADIWVALDVAAVVGTLRRPGSGDAIAAGLTEAPLASWTNPEDELALAPALARVFAGGVEENPWGSPARLGELTRVLISWARSVEQRADDPGPVGQVKGKAYALRAIAGAYERARLQQWLGAAKGFGTGSAGTTVEEWAQLTGNSLFRSVPAALAGGIPGALASPARLAELIRKLPDRLGEEGNDLGQAIWQSGSELAATLARLGAQAPGGEDDPAARIFRLLERSSAPAQLEAGLASAVNLFAPLALLGPAPDNDVRFSQLTGLAPTPLHWRFHRLKERRARRLDGLPIGAPLRPEDKLCGDELADFAAMLSTKWRANDWMWGRLDAAATLVDNLLDPDRLALLHETGIEGLLSGLEAALAMVPGGPEPWDFAGLPRPARRQLEEGPGPNRDRWDEWVAAVAQVRDCVVERLHCEILSTELPVVRHVTHEALDSNPKKALPAVTLDLAETKAEVAGYDVGLQGLGDLGDKRRIRLLLRAALVAFGTVRPTGASMAAVAGRAAASLLKPIYLIAAFVAASLRRGLFVAAIALAGLQVTYWQAEESFRWPHWWPAHWSGFTQAVTALAVLAGISYLTKRRPGTLVAAGGLAVLATLSGLWGAGGSWAVSTLLAVGLAAVTVTRWIGHARVRTVSRRDHALYAVTIAAGLSGIVVGRARAVCLTPGDATCDPWTAFAVPFTILLTVALVVGATGTFWMRRWCRGVVLLLVLGAYAGTAGPFLWKGSGRVAVASSVAAAVTAAALAGMAARDRWRRDRALPAPERAGDGVDGPRLPAWVQAAVAGVGAHLLNSTTVHWPKGTWVVLAVAGAGYSLTVLATYVDVLRPRPNRETETRPVEVRPRRVARPPEAEPEPAVTGEPVPTA